MVFTYNVNKRGERTPPCLTPDISRTSRDFILRHLISVECFKNHFSSIVIMLLLTSFSCKRHSMPKIFILSKAFFRLIEPILIVELRLLNYFITFRTAWIEL